MKFQLKNVRFGMQKKGEGIEWGRDPRRDWRFVFLLFIACNLLSIAFAVYLYAGINEGEIFLVEKKDTVPVATIDRAELQKTVSFFEERAERLKEFNRKGLSTPDPYTPL